MDDLSTAINGFLSKPGAMEQLSAMAQQLGLPFSGETGKVQDKSADLPDTQATQLPSGISPELMKGLMTVLQETSQPDDTAVFLQALRPLLSRPRQEKLDQALGMLRFMRAAQKAGLLLESQP